MERRVSVFASFWSVIGDAGLRKRSRGQEVLSEVNSRTPAARRFADKGAAHPFFLGGCSVRGGGAGGG